MHPLTDQEIALLPDIYARNYPAGRRRNIRGD
jgi:hypothetical protein